MFLTAMLQGGGSVGYQLGQKFEVFLQDFEKNSGDYIWTLIEIVFIFVASRFALRFVSHVTSKVMKSPRYHKTSTQGNRVDTIMTLVRSAARYASFFIALLLSLQRIGWGEAMRSVITVAGVGGIAIGFGAQSLLKDVITGLFLTFENQFSVGDHVKIGNDTGTVEATALRVTYLRATKGEKIIIPNGSIDRVTNFTRSSNMAMVTVPVAYEADIELELERLNEAIYAYALTVEEALVAQPEVQGVTEFAQGHMVVTIIAKTIAGKQWPVERGIRLAIKRHYDKLGVPFPYPKLAIRDGLKPPIERGAAPPELPAPAEQQTDKGEPGI